MAFSRGSFLCCACRSIICGFSSDVSHSRFVMRLYGLVASCLHDVFLCVSCEDTLNYKPAENCSCTAPRVQTRQGELNFWRRPS